MLEIGGNSPVLGADLVLIDFFVVQLHLLKNLPRGERFTGAAPQ